MLDWAEVRSRQSLAPTLVVEEETEGPEIDLESGDPEVEISRQVLADFGVDEMQFFLREQGIKGWFLHNFGGLVPGPIYLLPVALIVFVVELAGHFVKPTALAIRLFANMFAGHTLMAVLVSFGGAAAKGGMGFFGIGAITAASVLAAVLITFLELFVAFLQAFIFMFLTAVFISLMSHHDEEHEHEETPAAAESAVQPA